MIAERLPGDGIGLDSILSDVGDRILRYSISQSYPGYFAFPDTGITSLHLVGCADTEQPQAQGEHARCQRAQREAAGADIVLGAKHRTSLIKGRECGGKAKQIPAQPVEFQGPAQLAHEILEPQQRLSECCQSGRTRRIRLCG